MIEDGLVTGTSTEQHVLEQKVAKLYCDLEGTPVTDCSPPLRLLREEHIEYLHEGLGELPAGYASLDAGRPWICFWIIHSLSLLNAPWPARPAKRGERFGNPSNPCHDPAHAPPMQSPPAMLCLSCKHVLGYAVRGSFAWHGLGALSKGRTGGGPLLILCSAGHSSPLHS